MDRRWYCLILICGSLYLADAQKRTFVFGGGSIDEENAAVWNKIVELAGGRGVARIGVITAGSARPTEEGIRYTSWFKRYGAAEAYWIPISVDSPEKAYDAEVVARALNMSGFFYSGGNQPRVLSTFLTADGSDTPVLTAIRKQYNEGVVVAGTSGGALVQPGCNTVVAGWSYSAVKYGAKRVGENVGTRDLVYNAEGGLNFINSHVIDAHFSERGREGRLIRLLADTMGKSNGTPYGFGVDENTILVVRDVDGKEPTGEIFGYHGVVFVDMTRARIDTLQNYWQCKIADLNYLTEGDSIDLKTNKVAFGLGKRRVTGNESRNRPSTSSDIFKGASKGEQSEFRRVAEDLFNSPQESSYGMTHQSTPTYYVIMSKRVFSEAYASSNGKISYRRLRVDLRTVR